jgi:hypothetical protein
VQVQSGSVWPATTGTGSGYSSEPLRVATKLILTFWVSKPDRTYSPVDLTRPSGLAQSPVTALIAFTDM